MKSFQTFKKVVAQFTVSADGKYVFEFSKLAQRVGKYGWPAHLMMLTLVFSATPTTTAIPTQVELNKGAMKRVEINDGRQSRLIANGPQLRDFERMEHGAMYNADGHNIAATSGRPRFFARNLHFGIPGFQGNPSDFAMPCAAMKAGSLIIDGGALTDWASDCTAITGTLWVVAHYIAYGPDEIRIPPFVERKVVNVVSGSQIPGRAIYTHVGLNASAANAAWSVGDLGNISFDCGGYYVVDSMPAHVLGRCFHGEMKRGIVGGMVHEPADADDDVNQRDIDRTAATATKNVSNDLQPVLWTPEGARISKLAAVVDATAQITLTGSKTSTNPLLFTRIVPQSDETISRIAAEAAQELGMASRFKGAMPKTLSKKPYKGDFLQYMPWSAKFVA